MVGSSRSVINKTFPTFLWRTAFSRARAEVVRHVVQPTVIVLDIDRTGREGCRGRASAAAVSSRARQQHLCCANVLSLDRLAHASILS
jgi:hypothetical protein